MKSQKLPHTDSIQELAEFWDTHDLTAFQDELEEVSEPVFVRVVPIKVNFQSKEAEAVRKLARSQGISEAELIRTLVLKKLRNRKVPTKRKK